MKRMSVVVRGDRKTWGFTFLGDPAHLQEWRADGLDVCVIENSIPEWAVRFGLTRLYCFVQDVLNFKY